MDRFAPPSINDEPEGEGETLLCRRCECEVDSVNRRGICDGCDEDNAMRHHDER